MSLMTNEAARFFVGLPAARMFTVWEQSQVLCQDCFQTHSFNAAHEGKKYGTKPKENVLQIILLYLFIFGRARSSGLHRFFSSCHEQGLLSSLGARASHCGGFSCCGARARSAQASAVVAPGSRAQTQLSRTGFVAAPHVRSSRIRDQTHVSCIGSQIL